MHRIKRVQCPQGKPKEKKMHHKAILTSAEITDALGKAVLFSIVRKFNIFPEFSGFYLDLDPFPGPT